MSTSSTPTIRFLLLAPMLLWGVAAPSCGFSGGTGVTPTGGTTGAGGEPPSGGSGGASGGSGGGAGGTVASEGGAAGTVVATGGSAGGTTGGSGGAAGGAAGTTAPKVFQNYEVTGSFPKASVGVTQKTGTLTFKKVVIHSQFLAESCSIGDYNRDGTPDVSSGRIWYEGPDFAKPHAFREGHRELPRNGDGVEINTGVSDDWADFPWDVNSDGWTDIINVAQCDVPESNDPGATPDGNKGTPNKVGIVQPHATAYWYENPQKGAGQIGDLAWTKHLMHGDVRLEQHGLVDMNGDGFPEIYGACKNCTPPTTKGYYQRDPANPAAPWAYHAVSIAYQFPFGGLGWMHGEGAGDVNGDGLPDLLERGGAWLQQPGGTWNATKCTGKNTPAGCGWIAEKTPLLQTGFYDGGADGQGNKGASNMYAADMDGDGCADVVAADWAHGVGLFWYQQQKDASGCTSGFKKIQFMGDSAKDKLADVTKWGAGFTEPHSLDVVDMDGDGRLDVVTGKMRFAHPHGYGDPDSDSAPFIYVFKNVATPDSRSGVMSPITLEPHKVDGDDSKPAGSVEAGMGVGRHLAVGHVDTNGTMDICVGTKVGLAVFLQQ